MAQDKEDDAGVSAGEPPGVSAGEPPGVSAGEPPPSSSSPVDGLAKDLDDKLDLSASASPSSAVKTPVSILQELYIRRGITPKYDLVQIEGAVHEPTFKYRVTVGEIMATGCGQSKKKAKHMAAKAVLQKLAQANAKKEAKAAAAAGGANTGGKVDLPPNLDACVLSPYDDGIPGNPVGELQELCMNRRMPPPNYEVSLEEGQPHERVFIMITTVNKHSESGTGKSKKLSKRQAAWKMLQYLREIPVDNDDAFQIIDEDDLAQGIAQRNSAIKGMKSKGNVYGGLNVTKIYKSLKTGEGTVLGALQVEDSFNRASSRELLEDIATEQETSARRREEQTHTPETTERFFDAFEEVRADRQIDNVAI